MGYPETNFCVELFVAPRVSSFIVWIGREKTIIDSWDCPFRDCGIISMRGALYPRPCK